jgi:hypothetical protein
MVLAEWYSRYKSLANCYKDCHKDCYKDSNASHLKKSGARVSIESNWASIVDEIVGRIGSRWSWN